MEEMFTAPYAILLGSNTDGWNSRQSIRTRSQNVAGGVLMHQAHIARCRVYSLTYKLRSCTLLALQLSIY